MPTGSITSHNAALQVIRQAATAITNWANGESNTTPQQPDALRLVFDRIHLPDGHAHPNQSNYRPASPLETHKPEQTPRIPYAVGDRPTDFTSIKEEICKAAKDLDWENLSQLMMFLEVYGSHLSWGKPNADVAIIDQAKSKAAVKAALAQDPLAQNLVLIAGDLMGVQKFIYTISSDGALKSLRARSFFLEITTEEIVHRLLERLKLPRTNIIYAGASKFYVLAPKIEQTCEIVQALQDSFNDWLLRNFQKKVFLAMAVGEPFPASDLLPDAPLKDGTTRLTKYWQIVNEKLAAQALRKFDRIINEILEPQPSYEPCKVCHRDDTTDLDNLNPDDPTSAEACPTCRRMFALGEELLYAKALIRSDRACGKDEKRCFEINNAYYRVVTESVKAKQVSQDEIAFQINCWDLKAYSDRIFPLLLGNYGQKGEEGFMSAGEFAEESEGIKRVSYLRMDVDRLSQIFSKGLGANYTLPRLASLSRQMTYFFKVYLNSLARSRQPNFINYCDCPPLNLERLPRNPPRDPEKPDKNLRQNLLFIYAGGDDLFVSGAWDEVVAFGFDVYQSFRAYTGWHPDITLSGGIYIARAKFPLYQAAEEAGDAEDNAKDNGRDSLSLFGETFKWEQWLGKRGGSHLIDGASREYLQTEIIPDLQGVLPFVKELLNPQGLELSYPQSFIQNLLITAQLREQKIKETQKLQPAQVKDVTYYLHLPKLAYALSRLPSNIRGHASFTPIRQSLMSPRNSPYFRAIATWIELLTRNS